MQQLSERQRHGHQRREQAVKQNEECERDGDSAQGKHQRCSRLALGLVRDSLLEFAAFPFNQKLQLIEQLRVVRAERFHQIRKRQRGSIARSQQLPDALQRRARCISSGVWRGV